MCAGQGACLGEARHDASRWGSIEERHGRPEDGIQQAGVQVAGRPQASQCHHYEAGVQHDPRDERNAEIDAEEEHHLLGVAS